MNMYKRPKDYLADHVRLFRKTAIAGAVVIVTAIALTGCQGIFDEENMGDVDPRIEHGMLKQMEFNRSVGDPLYNHVRIPILGNPY